MLGLAELESLYGAERIRPVGDGALLDVDASDINFSRLGGTMKVARILAVRPTTNWPELFDFLYESMPAHLDSLPDGTFNLGVSTYALDVTVPELNRNLLKLKKLIKAKHPVRIVPNKTNELNSAQVLHNKLTHRGGWELLFYRDGQQTYLAQTMFVQDIEAYAARDQARPKRDARVGMLPPKLAQIIINLATGQLESREKLVSRDSKLETILDPFCGTGVILQEALLMGYGTLGSDIEPKMVDFTQQNLDWLNKFTGFSGILQSLAVADATKHQWQSFNFVASETYLGRAFTSAPSPSLLKQNLNDVNTILSKFLKNMSKHTKSGLRLCLAIPAWKSAGQTVNLPLLANLTEMGYNRIALKHVPFDELVYARAGQFVGRQLVLLERI